MATRNAEPALSDERAKQHLPPKSYKEAAEEAGVNGTGVGDGNGKDSGASTSRGDGGGGGKAVNGTGRAAAVLKIVDTGAPASAGEGNKEGNKENNRPQVERQESIHEYSATVCIPLPLLCSS